MDGAPTIVIRPLVDGDRRAAGQVYAHAFARLMRSMLRGRVDCAGEVMADVLVPSPNLWVAETDGVVAGLAWVQDRLLPTPTEKTWRLLRRHLPRRAAARAWVFSVMLHGVSVPGDRLYLDSLVVDPAFDGRGVGGTLLRSVIEEARRRDKAAVCLYVIDRDERPRSIYRRFGFVVRHSEAPRAFRTVIGFRRTDYMELELRESAGAVPAEPASSDGLLSRVVDGLLWRRLPAPPD